MNYDELPAGHEMNALIANRLALFRDLTATDAEIAVRHKIMPDYSGDDGAAVEILKHFAAIGRSARAFWGEDYAGLAWYVENFNDNNVPLYGWSFNDKSVFIHADTFALAVCRFALMATENWQD